MHSVCDGGLSMREECQHIKLSHFTLLQLMENQLIGCNIHQTHRRDKKGEWIGQLCSTVWFHSAKC